MNTVDDEIETKETNLKGDQYNETNVTKSGITETDGPVVNLLYTLKNYYRL